MPELAPCIPTTLHEWYHFEQETPVNDNNDVTRNKKCGAIWVSAIFQNCMPQRKSILDNISSSNLHRIIINLVSTHMFYGQRIE